jgi:general L-amino acid transport system permease protein
LSAIWAFRRYAHKRQEQTGDILPVFWVSLGLFFVPSILCYFILGRPVSLDYPELGGFNFTGGIQLRNSLIALWFALSLYTGAFIAEIVRAGILAVSKGQTEAAYALGLRPNRTMNLVILPQALRVIIPPLISQYLNLTKNSSLAIAVGYMDVRSTLGGITINQTGRELEGMLLLGCFLPRDIAHHLGVMNVYNNSVKLKER